MKLLNKIICLFKGHQYIETKGYDTKSPEFKVLLGSMLYASTPETKFHITEEKQCTRCKNIYTPFGGWTREKII